MKQKLASTLRTNADQLLLVIGERPYPSGKHLIFIINYFKIIFTNFLLSGKEQKLLSHLNYADNQSAWVVKLTSSAVTIGAQLTEVNDYFIFRLSIVYLVLVSYQLSLLIQNSDTIDLA